MLTIKQCGKNMFVHIKKIEKKTIKHASCFDKNYNFLFDSILTFWKKVGVKMIR